LLAHLRISWLLPVVAVEIEVLATAVGVAVLVATVQALELQAVEQVPNQNLVLHLALHTR
jgi:hypothetical protein